MDWFKNIDFRSETPGNVSKSVLQNKGALREDDGFHIGLDAAGSVVTSNMSGYLFLGKRWCLGVADGRRLGREHVAINPCVYFLRADDHSIGVCRGSRHAAPPRSRLRQPHPTSGGGQGRRRESRLLHYPLTEIARRVNVDSKQYPPPEPTNSLIPE